MAIRFRRPFSNIDLLHVQQNVIVSTLKKADGPSKKGGSVESRIESVVFSNDTRLAKLRADLDLPDKVQFGGYLLKVDDQDEFLGDISNGVYGFVTSPEQALQFNSFDDANLKARPEQREVVVALFEFGSKLIVAHVD